MRLSKIIFVYLFTALFWNSSFAAADEIAYLIKSNKTGLIKIDAESINSKFPELRTKNPKYFHLYKNGTEINFILKKLNSPWANDNAIYIIGEKNDGFLDKGLYEKPGAQLNPYRSLYSDTSIYILTHSTDYEGLIFEEQITNNPGVAINKIDVEQIYSFAEQYALGKDLGEGATQSEYTLGEGYTGVNWGMGSGQNRNFSVSNLASNSTVKLSTYVVGRSNALSANPNFNHHIQIGLIGASSQVLLDTMYKGYGCLSKTFNLASSLFNTDNTLQFISINDLGAQSDFNSCAYIKLNYTREANANFSNYLKFKLNYIGYVDLTFSDVQVDSIYLFSPNIGKFYKGDIVNNQVTFNIYSVPSRNWVLMSTKQKDLIDPDAIEKVEIKKASYANEEYDLIIISSKALKESATEYLEYKNSVNIKSTLVFAEDLYNTYTYGYHHPIAIKRFIDDYQAKAKKKAENVLIIGKGTQTNNYANPAFAKRDLVPIIGVPASDVLYVSSLNYSVIVPHTGIGRISSETNQEVHDYLNKMKEHDLISENEHWQKNIIHATGGRSVGENNSFSNALKICEGLAVQPKLGGKVYNFNKRVNEPVTDNYREKIIDLTNKGISLLTYFGHGANYFVEINFGEPEALNNKGKYPIYFLSGCSVGNPANDNSMGENYINAQSRGGLGWLASSDLGFPSYLNTYNYHFYKKAFVDNYGSNIGTILKECIKDFEQSGDSLNILHTRQFFYQGDPSFKFSLAENAEYSVANNGIYTSDKQFLKGDSVQLEFIVENKGRASSDSIEVKVDRQVNSSINLSYPIFKIKPVFYRDTFNFTIERTKELSGTNKISIQLDPNNSLVEENEGNNSSSKEIYLSTYAPILLQPRASSILKSNTLNLVIQCSDMYAKDILYKIELDTSANFNTGFKKSFSYVDQQLLKKDIKLENIESNKLMYIRVKISSTGQESEWISHQFTYLPNSENKWIQNKTEQLDSNYFYNTYLAGNQLKFSDNSVEFAINTRGDDARNDSVERRMRLNGSPPVYLGSGITGIAFLALNPKSLKRFSYTSQYNVPANTPDYPFEIYKYSGLFIFNTNNPVAVDSMIYYLNNIPPGYVVASYNGLEANLSTLPENALQALETLGLSKIRSITNKTPYAFVGYKGSAIGSAAELTANPSNGIPANEQFIRLNYEHIGTWDRGSLRSEKIGPSKKWKSATYQFIPNGNDEFKFNLIGYNTSGQQVVLKQSVNVSDSILLNDVDASTYPYLQYEVNMKDSVDFSPANFASWAANYQLPLELSVFPQYNFVLSPSKTMQGDSINYRIAFLNLGEEQVDSAEILLNAILPDRSSINLNKETVYNIKSNDTLVRSYKLGTRNLLGELDLQSSITQNIDAELISYNNSINHKIKVDEDTRAPKLSVLIDGKIPMQNDLISPRPLISLKLKDENPYLLLNDTNYVQMELKRPNDATFKKIGYSNSDVNYSTANTPANNEININYHPYFAEDGTYTLKVKVKDASNNTLANSDYSISFEVVNESTISNFYPYPNPFTTSAQFVFSLTGESLPDDLKIQIMTISGKIIKEIRMAELGPLKIGHNVTTYKWNGTDEFGDRLANGVYLYRVILKNNKDFKHRNTSGDKYFSGGFGKLYLMK